MENVPEAGGGGGCSSGDVTLIGNHSNDVHHANCSFIKFWGQQQQVLGKTVDIVL
jgi:hypothetical protein